jgi:hypothetical protein
LSAEELEESIRTAAAPFVNTAEGTHLNKIQLDNPKIKFQARLLFPTFVCYLCDGLIWSLIWMVALKV